MVLGCPPKILFFFFRRRRTLLANERKSARQPDPRRASHIVQALNWLTRPVYSSGDPLRSPCLGSSLSLISLAVSFASKVRRRLAHLCVSGRPDSLRYSILYAVKRLCAHLCVSGGPGSLRLPGPPLTLNTREL